MNCTCTVITKSHLPYAEAIYSALKKFSDYVHFEALVIDDELNIQNYNQHEGLIVMGISELCKTGTAKGIYDKYYTKNTNEFRWSMKPVLMSYLLTRGFEKVMCVDSDIYFFEDPTFLFDKLDYSDLLITPEWHTSNIWEDYTDFVRNHRHGLFNGGLVASTQNGKDALDWWARSCEFFCNIKMSDGLFGDQTYLDLFPVLFENVECIKHRGCNVANWNRRECVRTLSENGQLLINNEFPVVFVHMARDTMRGVFNGEDPLLLPFMEQYSDAVNKYAPSINLMERHSKRRKIFGVF